MTRGGLLLGREGELHRIDAVLQAAREGFSGALVLRGDPGIGKTALLNRAAETAIDAFVVRVTGFESEKELGFAGLHQALRPFLDRVPDLPELQRFALGSVLGLNDGGQPDRFLVSLAALTLLAEVAASLPALLLIVDDAQWLDSESAAVLAFIARRLYAERIAILFGTRESSGSGSPLDGLPSVEVPGLDRVIARQMLEAVMPARLNQMIVERIVDESGGNPLGLLELGRDTSPELLSRAAFSNEPWPIGRRLEARFLSQVQSLAAASQMLLLTAAADSGMASGLLWKAGRELGFARGDLRSAQEQGLVLEGPELVFRHPLIRSAVYHGATRSDRRAVHRTLASLVDGVREPDRRAWHLASAAAGPDEEIASELERVAVLARSRGGYNAEMVMRTRSAELTPDPARRAVRQVAAAQVGLVIGAFTEAISLVDSAEPDLIDPLTQLLAAEIRAKTPAASGGSPDGPRGIVGAVFATAKAYEDTDPELSREKLLETLLELVAARHLALGVTAQEVAEWILSRRHSAGGDQARTEHTDAREQLLTGFATMIAVGHAQAVPILRAALSGMEATSIFDDGSPAWLMLPTFAGFAIYDSHVALRWADRLVTQARAHGALHQLQYALLFRQTIGAASRGTAPCEADAIELHELSRVIDSQALREVPIVKVPELLAWEGVDDEAIAMGELFMAGAEVGGGAAAVLGEVALLLLFLARGRYSEALAIARKFCAEDVLNWKFQVIPDLVEAASRSGALESTTVDLLRLEQAATAAGTPWALGLLARSRALAAEAAEAEVHYRAAIAHLERADVVADLARAHLVYGEWLRRRKRRGDARRELEAAHQLFLGMGASAFADRARMELRAIGSRVGQTKQENLATELTPQERQIASLAAGLATNREIAAQLFLSPGTVDYHLRSVFRKLGVTSRRQLRQLVNEGPTRPSSK